MCIVVQKRLSCKDKEVLRVVLFLSAMTWQRFLSAVALWRRRMLSGDPAPPSFSQHLLKSRTALSGEPGLAQAKRCLVTALGMERCKAILIPPDFSTNRACGDALFSAHEIVGFNFEHHADGHKFRIVITRIRFQKSPQKSKLSFEVYLSLFWKEYRQRPRSITKE